MAHELRFPWERRHLARLHSNKQPAGRRRSQGIPSHPVSPSRETTPLPVLAADLLYLFLFKLHYPVHSPYTRMAHVRCGPGILASIVMPTSVHIPKPLLEAVDRKARALKMSRNRLIVRALERELKQESDWSPGFFEQLSAIDSETAAAVDELLASVRQARRSKPPRRL